MDTVRKPLQLLGRVRQKSSEEHSVKMETRISSELTSSTIVYAMC